MYNQNKSVIWGVKHRPSQTDYFRSKNIRRWGDARSRGFKKAVWHGSFARRTRCRIHEDIMLVKHVSAPSKAQAKRSEQKRDAEFHHLVNRVALFWTRSSSSAIYDSPSVRQKSHEPTLPARRYKKDAGFRRRDIFLSSSSSEEQDGT